MGKILEVKFMGADVDAMLTSMTKEIFGEAAQKKKNNIINGGLKESANYVLPKVWKNQRHRTGAMRMFTHVSRMRGGGWKISTPKREELETGYPGAKKSKAYYPAAMEYGFDNGKVQMDGDHAIKNAMDSARSSAISVASGFYRIKLDTAMKRYLKRKSKNG